MGGIQQETQSFGARVCGGPKRFQLESVGTCRPTRKSRVRDSLNQAWLKRQRAKGKEANPAHLPFLDGNVYRTQRVYISGSCARSVTVSLLAEREKRGGARQL